MPMVGDEVEGSGGKARNVAQVVTWQERRQRMQEVCTSCHADGLVSGFYKQFDDLVDLYDIKFAKPTTAIMTELTPLDEKLELTYDELWHHEGHGAAMSAPDYAWWPGIYEVAKTFYFSFLPEVKDLAGEKFADELLEKYVYNQPGHRWLKEGMSKEQLQKIEEFYRQRYGDQK